MTCSESAFSAWWETIVAGDGWEPLLDADDNLLQCTLALSRGESIRLTDERGEVIARVHQVGDDITVDYTLGKPETD